MDEQIVDAVAKLQEVAPHVWDAAIRDSYVGAGGYFLWAVCTGLMTYAVAKVPLPRHNEEDHTVVGAVFALRAFVVALFLMWTVGNMYDVVSNLVSPELHAYRCIVESWR